MRDIWTHSASYQQRFQNEDDVEGILALLELGSATGLVDVGCGNGAFSLAAAAKHPGCQVWAFDALQSAVAECRRRAGDATNVVAKVALAHALPLDDASVDRALCRSVLHHIADPAAVYAEAARVLKPGGRLVLQVPCNYWEPAFGDVLSELLIRIDDSHRRYFYTPAEIVSGLERAGFGVGEPDCWTYDFPYLDDVHAGFVRQHGASDRLSLDRVEQGKWSIRNYWCRVIATR